MLPPCGSENIYITGYHLLLLSPNDTTALINVHYKNHFVSTEFPLK